LNTQTQDVKLKDGKSAEGKATYDDITSISFLTPRQNNRALLIKGKVKTRRGGMFEIIPRFP
jgi:hypothetical protein